MAVVLAASLATPAAARPSAVAPLAVSVADDRVAAIEALLDRREHAVATGDVDEWMATVDPQAPVAQRDAERRAFTGWGQVPVASFDLAVDLDDAGDLAASQATALAARYGADEVFLPETVRRHRLAGYDDRDAVEYLWTTYVRRGGRWYVGGHDDLRPLGLDTARTLWELGPVSVRSTEHFLVVSAAGLDERAAQLADLAERAWTRFDGRWEGDWSGRLPMIVPASIADLEVILQTTFDLSNFVAFVSYDTVRTEGWEVTAPRIYVQDTNLARHGEAFQLDTLEHELVHAATSGWTGPHVDPWVHEGLAEWVAGGRPRSGRPPSGSDGRLPHPWEFRIGGSRSILTAYQESESFMGWLAGRSGSDAPVRFFRELGARRSTPGDADHNVSAVLADLAGAPLVDLEADWAR